LERELACATGEKPGEVGFSGALSLVISLDEQRKNKEPSEFVRSKTLLIRIC
jgi:hypothetical protein